VPNDSSSLRKNMGPSRQTKGRGARIETAQEVLAVPASRLWVAFSPGSGGIRTAPAKRGAWGLLNFLTDNLKEDVRGSRSMRCEGDGAGNLRFGDGSSIHRHATDKKAVGQTGVPF
jgi:hypothetical protein